MSAKQKVLVADDSLTIRKLVETVLSQENYEIVTATTGQECLKCANEQRPALILLDYVLPDMQGTEVCRQLVNSPDTWEIPVLMMSSNGNAIRQMYQDLNNVADYLTKPFAPNVLKAVVGHILQKDAVAPVTATPPSAELQAEMPSASAENLLEKVTRLVQLMESAPPAKASAPAATAAANTIEPLPAAAAPKKRSSRKHVTATPLPQSLLRKFKLAIQKHLRPRVAQVPEWEVARATAAPEEYYLGRLLPKELLAELGADLVRATGNPGNATHAFRCPAALVPLDLVLHHLHDRRVTGELHVEMPEETVLICFQEGEVVFLSSNQPRYYCAGANCDFQSVPPALISEAVRQQEEHYLPFFITLHEASQLPPTASLPELLMIQGQECLSRAFTCREAINSFYPLAKLSTLARKHNTTLPFAQALLICYRTVNDWFTLEQHFSNMGAAIVLTEEATQIRAGLVLTPAEEALLNQISGEPTIQQLAGQAAETPFEICRLLFRLIKLDLVRQISPAPAPAALEEGKPPAPQIAPTPELPQPAPTEAAIGSSDHLAPERDDQSLALTNSSACPPPSTSVVPPPDHG